MSIYALLIKSTVFMKTEMFFKLIELLKYVIGSITVILEIPLQKYCFLVRKLPKLELFLLEPTVTPNTLVL